MAKQLLFIQGGGEGTHDEWDNKLVASLQKEVGSSYEIRYPRMPDEADPRYISWQDALKKEFASLEGGAILVAHSIGATILINVLAEKASIVKPAGIFLISAPFVGKGGWSSDDIVPTENLGAKLPKQSPIYLYHGTEDETAPLTHVDLYQQAIPQAVVRKLTGRDHQLNNDLSEVGADIRMIGFQ